MDRTPIQQKLFGEGGFTGVGVGNNRKVAAPAHGGGQLGQFWGWAAQGTRRHGANLEATPDLQIAVIEGGHLQALLAHRQAG